MSTSEAASKEKILPVGHWFKVIWVNTWRVAATVMYIQPRRDWPYEQLIRNPVGRTRIVAAQFVLDASVSVLITAARPDPTLSWFAFVDLG